MAQDLDESPHASLRYTPQIQLLPKDPQPYLQITSSNIHLSFDENYKVFVVQCNGKEVDITNHVLLRSLDNQIVIRLAYLPVDFGTNPVYLKIDRFGNNSAYYYSNKILITRYNEDLTSRLDYLDNTKVIQSAGITENTEGEYQSIRLQLYYNNSVDSTEVETYYQITRSQNIIPRVSIKYYKKWKTQLFNAWTLTRLATALYEGKCYINQTRNYIVEGFERVEREGQSNISENEFLTDPDESDTINIIPVIIDEDWETIPFLSSASQLSSSSFLSSQSQITIPIP